MKTSISIQFLALLRGINVGGNNIIKMVDLKKCFESMGFSDVTTYIQSGNIIFNSDEKDKSKILDKVEKELSNNFKYDAKAVVISYKELKEFEEDLHKHVHLENNILFPKAIELENQLH